MKAPYTFVSIAAPQVLPERKMVPAKHQRGNLMRSVEFWAHYARKDVREGERPIDAYARLLAQNFNALLAHYKLRVPAINERGLLYAALAAWRRIHPVGIKLGRPATFRSLSDRVRSHLAKRERS